MTAKIKAHVIVSGRVQGVFFRAETKRTAERFGVFGWVRNKGDGTVEALFEGERERVESMVNWCKGGPPHAKVKSVDIEWDDSSGELGSFEIR
ncbi:MAG: acylphosphatase [Desulfobacterales bacterium]|nr:acylphosphatase [Desulfobacterales bacterium]